jgi:hypothetical protein
MHINRLPVLALALMLGSCASSPPVTGDAPVWGRIDCQRGEGNPALQAEFDEAKALCLSRGESAAAVAGTAGPNACMSEQGYVLRTRSEHKVACEATPAQKNVAKKRVSTSKPKPAPVQDEPAAPAKQ